ncbi:COX15/CtaA family protein [Methylovirgula sp. 4M-Z18]|uniref:COX15/CtaA family protein n=1 Tax=Methylovirgula sp. 4M-Z18 TaxID=2293567 RepID=UPI000E2F8C0B|nr:COX15/CtaA family protein [Methylovirgula sp. 4M-Z18]RFB81480.1 heme A synthase [Methylovirgula sp. 4M-Z18]
MSAIAGSVQAKATRSVDGKAVQIWLWCIAAMIFAIVVVGGATRLTESGLSITEWKPISGVIPPLSADAWAAEFERYKQIPQYSKIFPDMDVDGFKFIFYWEWSHRLLARTIGLVALLPLLWFWFRGQLSRQLLPKAVLIPVLIGCEGLLGWFMVMSGLADRTEVSQYRLAAHLLLASFTFGYVTWLATGLIAKARQPERQSAFVRHFASVVLVLVFVQIGLGALVAGLRAGLTYNTWPMMDGHFVPPTEYLTSLAPAWRNLFENVVTVQFQHRMIAYLVVILAICQAFAAYGLGNGAKVQRRAVAVAGLALVQAAIGIVTLVLAVPLGAGLLHQAFAMVLFAMCVVHRRLSAR